MNIKTKYILSMLAACSSILTIPISYADAPDPSLLGPYPVGQTKDLITDTTRPGGVTRTTWTGLDYGIDPSLGGTGRAEIVDIFYPADSNSITSSTPKANFWGIPAQIWEQNGIRVGYDSVPAAQGAFPLVVFSVGLTEDSSQYSSQAYHMASQGIIVAMLRYHAGDFDFIDFTLPFLQEIESPGEAMALSNRGADLSQAIDLMLERNSTQGDIFNSRIDANKIAAAGHSLGGMAALGLAIGFNSVKGNPYGIPRDSRVKAVVLEDASAWLFPYSQLQNLNLPGMFFDSLEFGALCNVRAYAAGQSLHKYRVKITNSLHDTFTNDGCNLAGVLASLGLPPQYFDQCDSSLGVVSTQIASPIIYGYTIAFLKRELQNDQSFDNYFDPGQVYRAENGRFQYFHGNGGDMSWNPPTTVVEDLGFDGPDFYNQNPGSWVLDGNFRFWLNQPNQ